MLAGKLFVEPMYPRDGAVSILLLDRLMSRCSEEAGLVGVCAEARSEQVNSNEKQIPRCTRNDITFESRNDKGFKNRIDNIFDSWKNDNRAFEVERITEPPQKEGEVQKNKEK
jgi:hypothetical protein